MSIRWNSVTDAQSTPAHRVIVKTGSGFMTFGRLVFRLGALVWIGDDSKPIRGVESWLDPVALDENAQ